MTDRLLLVGIVLAGLAGACEPKLVVGTWSCPKPSDAGAGGDTGLSGTVDSPWSTGFEDGFCGYFRLDGRCYVAGDASYDTVTSPVHSGTRAAAFRVATSGSPDGAQARCFRHGELPSAAYYGAWYYIPTAASGLDNWNLFHFQGGEGRLDGLWDVTVTTDGDGVLRLSVYDFLHTTWHQATPTVPVPIAKWFHIQLYLKRAADTTGEFALYQDGQQLFELKGLITDNTDYGQWYVGNLARSLTPPELTLYVDDVTIAETL